MVDRLPKGTDVPGKDNRRAPRKRHDSVLEIFDESGHLIAGVGRLVDISAVGACFSSTTSFEKGQKLHVRLRLLREGPIQLKAHIIWSRRKTNQMLYGMAFDKIEKKIGGAVR